MVQLRMQTHHYRTKRKSKHTDIALTYIHRFPDVVILIYVLNNAGQDLGVPNLKQRPPIAKLSNYISTFATGQHKPVRPLVCVLYRPCTLNCITLATSKTSSTISTMCNINMHKLFGNISMCNIHIYV